MIKVETGSSTILRYDNILDAETCLEIYHTILPLSRATAAGTQLPWFEGQTWNWWQVANPKLKKRIADYKVLIEQLVSEHFDQPLYSEFTDLVLWQTGQSMNRHKDDGYEVNDPLQYRVVSSVTYINDNFAGGETFIKTEHGYDYISKPQVGSFVAYLSTDANAHGVNLVESGHRLTMPTWFCSDRTRSDCHLRNQF